jgi:sortase A
MITNSEYRKIILLNIIFLAIIGMAVYFYIQKPVEKPAIVVPVPEDIYTGPVSTSTPVRVLVPEVGIDGNVIPVGIGKTGNMAVPVKYEDIGWYKYGPVPGQKGNAVLAGHVDDGRGNPAIFYKLNEVKVGNFVYIENSNGEKIKFVVKEIRLVDYSNPSKADMQAIFGKDENEGLNLITCEGTWIPEKKTYSNRLVIFTERVKS